MHEELKKQIEKARKALLESKSPLIFFDDDPDGIISFTLLYKLKQEGSGIIVNSTPELTPDFYRKVEEHQPDTIFVVDKPLVSQDFLDKVDVPVYWVDHHEPQDRKKVNYLNPKVYDKTDLRPTSYWAYKIADVRENLWLAMTGICADWFVCEELREDLKKDYPELLPDEVKKPDQALFTTKLGKLARIISFNLKGSIKDVNKAKKVLTRIEKPDEILKQSSSQGKFLYKRFEKLNTVYEDLLKSVNVTEDKMVVFTYENNKVSLTADLSNELIYKHPDKIILIGRRHGGDVKCSMRSATVPIADILKKSLQGIQGYGGGHEMAVGCVIKEDDFDLFIERFKDNLS